MPGRHTAKEKRQARHIIASYRRRGLAADDAEHIGWATVNKYQNSSPKTAKKVEKAVKLHTIDEVWKSMGEPTRKRAARPTTPMTWTGPSQKQKPAMPMPHVPEGVGGEGGSWLKPSKRKRQARATAATIPAPVMKSKKVRKSEDRQMSKYENFFKSALPDVELNTQEDGERVLIDCPHCDNPITKSEVIAKAAAGSMRHDNQGGKSHKGPGSGQNKKTPKRTAQGVPQYGKAGKPAEAKKAGDADTEVETVEKGDKACPKCGKANDMCKCGYTSKSVRVFGTDYVQYVDSGEDERIAKAIQEGRIGSASQLTQPIDRNFRNV